MRRLVQARETEPPPSGLDVETTVVRAGELDSWFPWTSPQVIRDFEDGRISAEDFSRLYRAEFPR